MIGRLCVIGVGLIGGSLALALRHAGAVKEIVGAGRDETHLRKAVDLGVIDRFELNAARAVEGADVVMLAVPLGAMQGVCGAIKDRLHANTVVTDAGSAKRSVVAAVRAVFGDIPTRFVPGHPIAGTERSGVEAASSALFCERRVILTPLANTAPSAIRTVRLMWEQTGARVEEMDVAHHDRVLAATSHLPHMLAFVLVDSLARMEEREEVFRYAASGFRDFTRIAASDPVMWHDICLANGDIIQTVIARYRSDLKLVEDAIVRHDAEQLLEIFSRAKRARDRLVEQ
ncbi:MAG: prephenate dehydrogenase/arogenate dehydrogenase family protein [Pseudomonadota bacterium]|nr:prephenate dehydrogenase/arogenate dehydrogenase family protein [Pseudomonadota bacterium]